MLVAENEPQDTKLIRPHEQGGDELDGLWNDDFHHTAIVALTGRNEAYYSDYRGAAAGIYFRRQIRIPLPGPAVFLAGSARGTTAFGFGPEVFVSFH